MSDKELMENYLLVLKSTVEVYVHGTLESSNDNVRDILSTGLEETLNHQMKVYNEMTKNGWYKVDNVKLASINKTLESLNCE